MPRSKLKIAAQLQALVGLVTRDKLIGGTTQNKDEVDRHIEETQARLAVLDEALKAETTDGILEQLNKLNLNQSAAELEVKKTGFLSQAINWLMNFVKTLLRIDPHAKIKQSLQNARNNLAENLEGLHQHKQRLEQAGKRQQQQIAENTLTYSRADINKSPNLQAAFRSVLRGAGGKDGVSDFMSGRARLNGEQIPPRQANETQDVYLRRVEQAIAAMTNNKSFQSLIRQVSADTLAQATLQTELRRVLPGLNDFHDFAHNTHFKDRMSLNWNVGSDGKLYLDCHCRIDELGPRDASREALIAERNSSLVEASMRVSFTPGENNSLTASITHFEVVNHVPEVLSFSSEVTAPGWTKVAGGHSHASDGAQVADSLEDNKESPEGLHH